MPNTAGHTLKAFDEDLAALTAQEFVQRELLDRLAARLVVEETGDRFVFRHALTREAIYVGLPERTGFGTFAPIRKPVGSFMSSRARLEGDAQGRAQPG